MTNKNRPLRGFRYFSFEECKIYNFIRDEFFKLIEKYNIKIMIPPILAEKKLFTALGEASDVVRKELYSFTQKDGEDVCLVPELTRIMVEQFAHDGKITGKYGAWGPCFRYERPQKGRYRSFTQVSLEFIGYNNYMHDIELILFIENFLKNIHINNYIIHINTIGSIEDRSNYVEILQDYFEPLLNEMSENAKEKFKRKAYLRMLDSKDEEDQKYINNAPKMKLSEKSKESYENIKSTLNDLNIKYVENPLLVRGLDYYNDIVFEYTHNGLGSQSAILGGGRYDGLCKETIGTSFSAVGMGAGIDRLILILENEIKNNETLKNKILGKKNIITIIPIEPTEYLYSLKIEKILLDLHLIYVNILYDGKVSKRMEKAKNSDQVILIGKTERQLETLNIKNMKDGTSKTISIENLVEYIKNIYK